ncbi:MAG TPA: YgaP-like transmembrane domain [Aggregatilineaceae bacterium]|nr:YgaP-like transmembrane domain [Aggregatilineaceae bacterium]
MDGVFRFLASRNGRITRIVVGVILVVIGLAIGFQTGSIVGWIVTVIGLFPLIAGALDLCLLGPFFGHSFRGAELRSELEGKSTPPAR